MGGCVPVSDEEVMCGMDGRDVMRVVCDVVWDNGSVGECGVFSVGVEECDRVSCSVEWEYITRGGAPHGHRDGGRIVSDVGGGRDRRPAMANLMDGVSRWMTSSRPFTQSSHLRIVCVHSHHTPHRSHPMCSPQ